MTIGSFLEKNRIKDFINEYNMLSKGDAVVLGLSGGPDSVCLFFVLLELVKEYDLKLLAIHINHCIRGKDADEDQEFVEKLCEKNGVQCISIKADIPHMAKESGRSLEEEARLFRYEKFEEAAQEFEKNGVRAKIAIAHNLNDNAETVMFHMARGAGLDGMCGIAPCRDKIIRPLLRVRKEDILAFLDESGSAYCIDATNAQVEYDRNRIRHNVLPELSQINDKSLEHIGTMTEKLREVSEFLQVEADGLLQMAREDENRLRKRTLATAPRVIASQALKTYLSGFMPFKKDVSEAHIEAALSLLKEDGEKYVDLPYKKRLIISYEEIFVVDLGEDASENSQQKGNFTLNEFALEPGTTYPDSNYTKWFDYDKITHNIEIRTRREGDYLQINSSGGKKSVKDYFIDNKVPKHKRDQIPLVCDGDHVLWIVGYRISEFYKISKDTTRVLEIVYTEEI